TFTSHLDGTPTSLSPECVVELQERLGADLIMPLDVCLGPAASRAEAADGLEHTLAWWKRSLSAHRRDDQALFALVQGGLFSDLQGARLNLSRRDLLPQSGPIVADCTCAVCTYWPLGALAALYQAREPVAYRLASMHNLTLLNRVLRALRETVVYTAL